MIGSAFFLPRLRFQCNKEAALFTKFPDDLWPHLRTPAEIAVMLRVLKLCGFDGTGECFESADTFAAHCGMTRRTLTDVLRKLEAKQLVLVERRQKCVNRITLGETVKAMSFWGKNFPQKDNTNIFMREKFSPKTSEVERIHAKWLKNKDKGKEST